MPDKLNEMDVPRLQAHLSLLTNKQAEYSKLYQQGISDLTNLQNARIEASKLENAHKNSLKIIKDKISQNKEEIRSVKILLRSESAGL